MKTSFLTLLLLILASLAVFGQAHRNEKVSFDIKGFKPVPNQDKFIDKTHLLSKITPDSAYVYWEAIHVSEQSWLKGNRRAIASHGNRNYASVASKVSANYGFFVECHPMRCYTYIVGVKSDGQVDIIDDDNKLKTFIGNVDNIEEAMLYATINGYWFDTDSVLGGAYKERKDDYLLYLLDYESSTKDGRTSTVSYKSVKAILSKSGDFRVVGKKVYKQFQEPFSID
jgi:hypothetical protein